MIHIPAIDSLQPKLFQLDNGNMVYLFPDGASPLLKLDFLFEAGSAYQPQPLCASAANRLLTCATQRMSPEQVSEFIDHRGIVIEANPDIFQSGITVYTLRRHVDDLFPLLDEMFRHPSFPDEEVKLWCGKRKQELLANQMKTAMVARHLFYETLFGLNHPLGAHAIPSDADVLNRQTVASFFNQRYCVGNMTIVASGAVDNKVLDYVNRLWGNTSAVSLSRISLSPMESVAARRESRIDDAVQTSLRIGRVLPFKWNELDLSRFMILSTVLGGYFGSRLMQTIREEKGFTYGISARTQLHRGCILFYITTDVAQGTADEAEECIFKEMDVLCKEPISTQEFDVVKNVIVADFIRSVDGVFERSARFCQMLSSDVSEQLTENLHNALQNTTAVQLVELARWLFSRNSMVICRTGA